MPQTLDGSRIQDPTPASRPRYNLARSYNCTQMCLLSSRPVLTRELLVALADREGRGPAVQQYGRGSVPALGGGGAAHLPGGCRCRGGPALPGAFGLRRLQVRIILQPLPFVLFKHTRPRNLARRVYGNGVRHIDFHLRITFTASTRA